MTRQGRCYILALEFLIKNELLNSYILIHGSVEARNPEAKEKKRIFHAWIETDAGYVYEPVTDSFIKLEDFERISNPIRIKSYSTMEAFLLANKNNHYGPWTEED